jgi:putative ABC transport system permease protein
MLRTTLAGLRAHKLRLVATAVAIVLGVGFVAGTLVFGDTVRAALYDQFARPAQHVDVAVQADTGGGKGTDPTLPTSTVDTVGAVPGVSAVDGRMAEPLPLLDKRGKLVGNGNNPGVGLSAGTVPALRPYDVTAGRAPATTGEAALDADTAARTRYAVGDTITVVDTAQHKHPLTLVGIVSFGTSKQYAGQAVVVLVPAELTSLTGVTGYRQLVATATAGTAADDLARRVSAALAGDAALAGAVPGGAQVRTGAQYRDDLATNAISQFGPFLTVLLIFAVIACVVCAFVIYNTFNILVAQRIRELALLRCVGARRRQVFGSVLLESAVVGLIGAVLGVALGLLVALGLFSGTAALGAPLPAHRLVLTATPVVVALLLGLLVTVTAAAVPAVRATRVPPLAALGIPGLGVAGPGTLPGRRRRALQVAPALLVAALGTVLTLVGSTATNLAGGAGQGPALIVVAGGMVNFLAVLLLSPLFVGPLTAAVGWLPGRIFGVPAKLAAVNARRNPGRAAATTAALMIGVGLMSAASVTLATVRATATGQLTLHYPVDYILQAGNPDSKGDQGRPGIPSEVASRLRGNDKLGLVAAVRLADARLDGKRLTAGTVDAAGRTALLGSALPLSAGSTADFRPGTVILFTSAPAADNKHVGDAVTLSTPDGHSGTFTVVALATGQSQTGDAILDGSDFAALHPSTMDDVVLVRARDGVSPAESRAAVEAVTDDYPLVEVDSLADWRAQITSAVDTLIGVVAALLGVAILIALIGIMNTLSLSVFERTRESATLRALGLTRGQLRAMLLAEALLMGVVGALVGVAFGVLYGWATTRVLFTGFAAVITVPVGQLAGYVLLAAGAAVVAAVLPAGRAARASIVSAMAQA